MKNLLFIIAIFLCHGAYAQWNQIFSNTTKDLHDIYFVDSLTGYCVGSGTSVGMPLVKGVILETTNGGENWSTIFSQDSVSIRQVGVITENGNSKLLAFARKDNESYLIWAYISEDSISWNIEPVNYRPYFIQVYENDLYFNDIFDGFKLKRISDNSIETITTSSVNLFSIKSNGIIAYTGGLGIRKSLDFGNNWTDIPSPDLGSRKSLEMFGDTIIFTTTFSNATVFSYDNGVSWSYFEYGVSQNAVIVSPRILFTAFANTVSLTTNTGESWEIVGTNFNVNKLYFKDNLGFIVGPEGSIYKLDNVGALGINEPLKTNMKIYPNPSSNYVTLDFDADVSIRSIELMDMNGKVVKTYPQTQSQLDLTGTASGIYILKIETDMGLVSKRVVVE